jgi:Protein of unknown function (DUF2878)
MRRAHLVNYALYQVGWFACVLGAASHRPWTGCLIALSLVGVHLTRSLERSIEVRRPVSSSVPRIVTDGCEFPAGHGAFSTFTKRLSSEPHNAYGP